MLKPLVQDHALRVTGCVWVGTRLQDRYQSKARASLWAGGKAQVRGIGKWVRIQEKQFMLPASVPMSGVCFWNGKVDGIVRVVFFCLFKTQVRMNSKVLLYMAQELYSISWE